MSIIFTTFGILSFVLFGFTIYVQNKQIKQLKKIVRTQRKTLENLSIPLPQDLDSEKQRFDESWAEIKKIFDHDITKN